MAATPYQAFGLRADEIARIQAVLAGNPNVRRAWMIGSRAMGTYREGSDIDLVLEGPQLSHRDRAQLSWDLDELNLLLRFDLLLRRELKGGIAEHFQQEGRRFYDPAQYWRRDASAV
jgi:predicted nucleotidyltransferase